MYKYLLYLFFISLVSCDFLKESEKTLPSSSGKYGEVLVIIDSTYEKGKTGESLLKIFNESLVGTPQQEAQFRMSTVAHDGFKSILQRGRNILKININKGRKTDLKIAKDVWAKDQLLIQISAADDETAARILDKNKQTIRDYFNEEELTRLQRQHKIRLQLDLMEQLNADYDIQMEIPPGYAMAGKTDLGFWLKKEKKIGEHLVMQGIIVQWTPYESDSTFTAAELIRRRDNITKSLIEGARTGSYMKVFSEYKPEQKTINLNNVYTVEYRGLWKMENDFMGGSYLHYTFVDEQNSRVIDLDGFVYAPQFGKREYLRELEAILKTVKL